MKHWITRSPRLGDRIGAALAAALMALPLAACVTRGTYNEMTAERDALAIRTRQLEEKLQHMSLSIESLDSERTKLLDELESLRIKRDQLDSAVSRLRTSEAQLSESLKAREEELANRQQEIGRLRGTYENLVADLESEVASGQIEIEQLREGLRLNVADEILFPSGSATLNQSGLRVLRKVAKQLVKLGNRVEIQGHTDNVPIRPDAATKYPSNWELAAARATVVVRLLAAEGVDPRLLSAVSFGEYQPVASNDTPEGRLRNRRIEIRLQPVAAPPPEAEGAGPVGAPPEPTSPAPSPGPPSAGGTPPAAPPAPAPETPPAS
jgi:chemotaxis protein MotB